MQAGDKDGAVEKIPESESEDRHLPDNCSNRRKSRKNFFFFWLAFFSFFFWQVVVIQVMVPIRTYGEINESLPLFHVGQI